MPLRCDLLGRANVRSSRLQDQTVPTAAVRVVDLTEDTLTFAASLPLWQTLPPMSRLMMFEKLHSWSTDTITF